MDILKGFGAGAGFQLQDCWSRPERGRRKLQRLANMGIIMKHQLVGERCTLNVYTPFLPGVPRVEDLLKRVSLLQLHLVSGTPVFPADAPLDGVWLYGDRTLPVISVRGGTEVLRFLPWNWIKKEHGRVVVISPEPVGFDLPVPARLLWDRELLGGRLVFRFPDGRVDTGPAAQPSLGIDSIFPREYNGSR